MEGWKLSKISVMLLFSLNFCACSDLCSRCVYLSNLNVKEDLDGYDTGSGGGSDSYQVVILVQ